MPVEVATVHGRNGESRRGNVANELEIGCWLIKTEGEAAAVLAMDAALLAHQDHWLVRETTGLLRRRL